MMRPCIPGCGAQLRPRRQCWKPQGLGLRQNFPPQPLHRKIFRRAIVKKKTVDKCVDLSKDLHANDDVIPSIRHGGMRECGDRRSNKWGFGELRVPTISVGQVVARLLQGKPGENQVLWFHDIFGHLGWRYIIFYQKLLLRTLALALQLWLRCRSLCWCAGAHRAHTEINFDGWKALWKICSAKFLDWSWDGVHIDWLLYVGCMIVQHLGVSLFWSVSDLKLLLSLDSSFSPSSICVRGYINKLIR